MKLSKLTKTSKKVLAIVLALALTFVGNYFMPKTVNAAQLQWTELYDGVGSATMTNTSTDSAYGASFVGFVTNDEWGPNSKWQGQAKKEGISVESGKEYKVSVDMTASAQKKILIQTLCGGTYTEKIYTINSTKQHIDFKFHADGNTVQVVFGLGSQYDAGTYDIYIEDMTVEEVGPEPSVLEWTELADGLGHATVTDTCTESTFGATFDGFQTDMSWGTAGSDSIWQGQAKKTNYPVENGKDYTLSLDASSSPGKKFRVQVLCNGTYTEDTFDVSSNTHIDLPFTATGSSIDFIVAFGATSYSEVGTYDIEISNLSIDKEEEPSTPEPESTTAGPGDWITVDSSHMDDTMYRLGTTTDFADNGKWYLKTQDNSWENWEGAYKDAGDIEGFGFDNRVYHDAGGIFLWSSDLKSEFNLTPGTTYNMSVTLSYTGVDAAQNNYVLTEGGSSNMNLTRTVAAGTSTETYTGSVVPTANSDFVLRISWASLGYETAEVGQFEVTDVTFTEDTTWTNCTVDDEYHTIGTGGFQYKFRGASTARYKTGTGTDMSHPLDIEITNGINNSHDFQTLSPVVQQLTAGNKYRLTYNVSNLGTLDTQDLGANVYTSVLDATNDRELATTYDDPVAVAHGNNVDIVLDFIAPASGEVYFKLNSSYTPATELVLTPSYTDVTPTGYTSVVGDGSFHTIGSTGFQYMFASGEYVKYKGGTSFSDPLDAWVTIPTGTDHDFQTKTPVASVSAGHYYKLKYNVSNIGAKDTCDNAQIYAEVCNASNDASLATSWNNKIKVNAGTDADIELEFMAPPSGQVYVKLNSSYTWSTELVLTPELIDQSPGFSACTADDWTFVGSNNTGWQYYVASPGSAYNGGTNFGDDLVVNYNDYIPNRDHSLMARTPITQVDSGKTYTGSISIKNGSGTALTANNVSVSVHWVNGDQDGAIEGTVQSGAIAAGATGTFNFSYTAPDSGYIFYEATTSYTPEHAQYTFSATHTPPSDARYDVAAYKSGSTATYPTATGEVFAGWFDDAACTQVHSGNTGLAYAKFIDVKAVDCKFQLKNDRTAVRFVSTIDDCLDYSSVGFKIIGNYGDSKHFDTEKTCTKVYRKINADGETLTPSTAFDNTDSAYFFTFAVRNMNASTKSDWTVTPFYVTPDGTKVYGTTKEYSIN